MASDNRQPFIDRISKLEIKKKMEKKLNMK